MCGPSCIQYRERSCRLPVAQAGSPVPESDVGLRAWCTHGLG